MLSSFFPEQTIWESLQNTTLPIVLYGTGDGADKILALMDAYSIPLTAIFVSDDFFRGQSFHGIPVTTLSALEQRYEEMIIVVAFGSHLPEILDRVVRMSQRHPLVVPDVPVYGDHVFDRTFAQSHLQELEEAYSLLADEASRQVFLQVLQYKLTGSLSLLLSSSSEKTEVFRDLIPLNDHENYVDLGAYRGDTIEEFLTQTGGAYRSITALEPDPRTFKKLSEYAKDLPRTQLFPYGASSDSEIVYMKTGRGRGSSKGGGTPIQMTSIDRLELQPTYLKMDVEGFEKQALLGAASTLTLHKPKLNIACYHRSEDLFELPLLIHQLQPQYQIFMRRHPCLPCWDLNLYCR